MPFIPYHEYIYYNIDKTSTNTTYTSYNDDTQWYFTVLTTKYDEYIASKKKIEYDDKEII